MSNENAPSESDTLTPKDMQQWLLREIRDSAKAHELRVKSATELVTAYALGEIEPEQAMERFFEHHSRWGEAIPGTHAFPKSTDEEIIAAIDKARDFEEGRSTSFEARVRPGTGHHSR